MSGDGTGKVCDEKIGFRSDAQFFVAWIDKLIAMVEQRGRFPGEDKKREVVALFQKGRATTSAGICWPRTSISNLVPTFAAAAGR